MSIKYLDNLRGFYTPTTAFGYHEKLKALVLEDLQNKFMKSNFSWKSGIIDPIYLSQLLKEAIGLYKGELISPTNREYIVALINDLFQRRAQNSLESSSKDSVMVSKDAKKILGIPYTQEEIFATSLRYGNDDRGLCPQIMTNEIWRESGEFRLELGEVKIELVKAVDDLGWLYGITQNKEQKFLGCLFLNK